MKKYILTCACLLTIISTSIADEGLWLPSLIGKMRYEDMKAKGLKITDKDLYNVNNASLKDAILRFGNGCTAEIISDNGLLITNHHCGYSQIQAHSSVENDYLTDGFWAKNNAQELPNPGLVVSRLVKMVDVTKQSLKGVTDKTSEVERKKIIANNNAKLIAKAVEGNHYSASVEPFYYGNQYFMFVYEVFRDIRLVGAPASSIGKFGGDTDNWIWPRHTGDFSFFRIYTDKNNKPADYSTENVPYKPLKSFVISLDGAAEGDFTFVYGFPGRTFQYITSDAVDYLVNLGNPHKIKLRTIRLNIMNNEQAKDAVTRIKYASKNAKVANSWKKWQGELKGVVRMDVIDIKRKQEKEFSQWAALKPKYANVLDSLSDSYKKLSDYAFARDYYTETYDAIEITEFADIFSKVTQPDDAKIAQLKKGSDNFFKNYSTVIDKRIAVEMLFEYAKNISKEFYPSVMNEIGTDKDQVKNYVDKLFDNSVFASQSKVEELLKLPTAEFATVVANDPAVILGKSFSELYRTKVWTDYNNISANINLLYRTYMQGIMEMQPNRMFYPDANFTLRIAYGEVKGYKPADAVYYTPYSTLDGVMEKDSPEIYDYDVPQKLRDIYNSKDYGIWESNGSVPVAFIATNHTTGGNSGSPILNARGELLGLNFDRTWESTMSDIMYDPQICRNISVDIRYVLFVVDKVAGAGYLLDEMKFSEGEPMIRMRASKKSR